MPYCPLVRPHYPIFQGEATLPVSRTDVAWAYRTLLGREPETEDVVVQHMASHDDLAGLVQAFAESREFALRLSGNGTRPPAKRDGEQASDFLLIGNCHVRPIARCLQALTGEAFPDTMILYPRIVQDIRDGKIEKDERVPH